MNICTIIPYNLFMANHGNAIRVYYLIKTLISLGHKVSLIMCDLPYRRKIDKLPNVSIHFMAVKVENIAIAALMRLVFKASAYDLICVTIGPSRHYKEKLRKIIREEKIDVIQCENLWAVPQALPIAKEEEIPIVVTAHDVLTDRFQQLYEYQKTPEWLSKKLIERVESLEVSSFKECNAVVCVSEGDKRRFGDLGLDSCKFIVIPNGVDINKVGLTYKGAYQEDAPLLFFAGSRMFQNEKAVDDIIQFILPPVLRAKPKTKIYFAGTICDYIRKMKIHKIYPENIVTLGYVEDISYYYNLSDIVILPITVGTGTKLKTVEAMAHGKPIISTSMGAAGLDTKSGEHLVIEDDIPKFSHHILDLLANKSLMQRLGQNARKKAEDYDWKKLMQVYDKIYQQLKCS